MTFSPLACDSDGEKGNSKIEEREKRKYNGIARVTRAAVPSGWKTTFGSEKNPPRPWLEALPCSHWFGFSNVLQAATKPGWLDFPGARVRQRGEVTHKQTSDKCLCRRYTQPSGGETQGERRCWHGAAAVSGGSNGFY